MSVDAACQTCGTLLYGGTCPVCPRYASPASELADFGERLARGEVAPEAVLAQVTARVTALLEAARQDLARKLQGAATLPSQVKALSSDEQVDLVVYVETFQDVQERVHAALAQFGQALGQVRGPADLPACRAAFQHLALLLGDAVDKLNVLYLQNADPDFVLRPPQPLPPELAGGIDSLEQAMDLIGRYIEKRRRDDLAEGLARLDEARTRLAELLRDSAE